MKQGTLTRLVFALALGVLSLTALQLALVTPQAAAPTSRAAPPGSGFRSSAPAPGLGPSGFAAAAGERGISPRISASAGPPGLSSRSHPTDTLDQSVFLPIVGTPRPMVEARALWMTRWNYSTVTDVQTLIQKAAGAGFNMVLFQVRGAADAYYTPGLEPWSARLSGILGEDPGWDPLQVAIDTAHGLGLELHAWLNVYPVWLGQTPPITGTEPEHLFWTLSQDYPGDEWRVVDDEGVTMTLRASYLYATPALTDVVDHVVSVSQDIVDRYQVDGIHLDHVRYPGPQYSYDPFSNAGYEAALAEEEHLTRAEWQRRQVSRLVSRVYAEAILPRSEVRLSAAVWPLYQDLWDWGYPVGYDHYYQDSQAWVQSGTMDAILPMLYTHVFRSDPEALTPTQFSLAAADFLAHDGGRHVFPGISAEHLDFDGIAERIALARELGAPGHAVFQAGLLEEKGYWDDLASGPYAIKGVIPPMSWRTPSDVHTRP